MKYPLISIITPAFNNASILHRLLDSVLGQTYPNIEMFLIDDGSTDNTKDITEHYIKKFEERGYNLTYIYQENSGQSVAINTGLKLIHGEYLLWPDSDDFYASSKTIETLYTVLSNENTDIARCMANYLDEKTLKVIGKSKAITKPRLFEDCLFVKNKFSFIAGGYMIKTSNIEKYIPNKEIYTEKRAGQNWQLMLPFLYGNNCITVTEPLYNIVCRSNSHSRELLDSYEKYTELLDAYQRTIIETINRTPLISQEEKIKYNWKITEKYHNLRLAYALNIDDKNNIAKLYQIAKEEGIRINTKSKIRIQYPFIYKTLYFIKKCLRK